MGARRPVDPRAARRRPLSRRRSTARSAGSPTRRQTEIDAHVSRDRPLPLLRPRPESLRRSTLAERRRAAADRATAAAPSAGARPNSSLRRRWTAAPAIGGRPTTAARGRPGRRKPGPGRHPRRDRRRTAPASTTSAIRPPARPTRWSTLCDATRTAAAGSRSTSAPIPTSTSPGSTGRRTAARCSSSARAATRSGSTCSRVDPATGAARRSCSAKPRRRWINLNDNLQAAQRRQPDLGLRALRLLTISTASRAGSGRSSPAATGR